MPEMEITLRYIEVSGILIAAIGAVIFGWKQFQLNKRAQELADYVSISIIPAVDPQGNYELQVMNVGKINVYLKKFEVGQVSFTFQRRKERLVSVGGNPFYRIPINNPQFGQEMNIRLYLLDEFGNKYLSTGAVIIDVAFATPPPQGQQNAQPQAPVNVGGTPVMIPGNVRAWSYKTHKHNWVL